MQIYFDAEIKVENVWLFLYINYIKKYDSICLPSREDLLDLRPKNILFAQQSILSLWNETFYIVLSAF